MKINRECTKLMNYLEGLSQGNALPPFLFLLVVDALSRLALFGVEEGWIVVEGFKVGKDLVHLSHFPFTVDIVFF